MKQKKSLLEKLRNKDLLWYSGVLLILLSLFGIGYGIWICYNGILIRNTTSNEILEILNNNTMTTQDGVYALILFGSIIIIYYLLMLGTGFIGVLTSGHLMIRQTLFWITIFLISLSIIFGFFGLLGLPLTITNLICLGLFILVVFRKYNLDINRIKKK